MTFWVAGALVGGALISSNAQKKSSETQAAAATQSGDIAKQTADAQLALQREQFDRTTAAQQKQYDQTAAMIKQQYDESVARQQPWLTAGTNALAKIQGGAGAPPVAFNPNDPSYARPAAFNANDPSYALPGAFSFGANDFQTDPGYAFRLSEGQRALERTAAARGGLVSGAALKAASRYSGDLASQEYGNAFNRAYTQYGTKVDTANTGFNRAFTGYNADVARADTGFNRALTGYNANVNASNEEYNRLAAMAGVGSTTAKDLSLLGSNYATNTANAGQSYADRLAAAGQNYTTGSSNAIGNQGASSIDALTGAANARASGYIGEANTLNNMVGTGLNYYQGQSYLNMLRPSGSRTSGRWNGTTFG